MQPIYKNPEYILITGASSGIGKYLAISYAKSGITLYLSGRNERRLKNTIKLCEEKGAIVHSFIGDVTDGKSISIWIKSITRLDLVIANAGISAGTGGGDESDEQVRKIFAVNIDGVLNTIHPAIDIMKKQGAGQVAIVSSLAGYRGLPGSPAYSASKAAVKVYGEALRGYLQKYNIAVSVVTPGYIRTPMTDVNKFPMPFLVDVEKAAKIIISGLARNKSRIAFPLPMYFVVWLCSCLPPFIVDPIFARLPGKE